jgi:hypothetical protein
MKHSHHLTGADLHAAAIVIEYIRRAFIDPDPVTGSYGGPGLRGLKAFAAIHNHRTVNVRKHRSFGTRYDQGQNDQTRNHFPDHAATLLLLTNSGLTFLAPQVTVFPTKLNKVAQLIIENKPMFDEIRVARFRQLYVKIFDNLSKRLLAVP